MTSYGESKPAAPASPPRPSLQLTRATSELSPPKHSATKKHRHHHPHLHRREKEDRTNLHSVLQHPSHNVSHTVGEIKSEGVTPAGSRNGSGHNSMLAERERLGELEASGMNLGKRRTITDAEVREEKEKAVLRATELRNSLMDMNAVSNETTRRLDTTYYSILEKLSTLHSTIRSMKDLAVMARQVTEDFDAETKYVVNEVETQVDPYRGFEEQDDKIEALEERIKRGRERVKELGDRLAVVRTRVDGWEKSEGEWKEKTKSRLRMLWLGMGLLLLAFLVLVMLPHMSLGTGIMQGLNGTNISANIPSLESMEWRAEEEVAKLTEAASKGIEDLRDAHKNQPTGEDPRLRLFDEL